MTNEELKPCPMCGGVATFDRDDDGWNWIECVKCKLSTVCMVDGMEDCKSILAERWNRRADQPKEPLSPLVKFLAWEAEQVTDTNVGEIQDQTERDFVAWWDADVIYPENNMAVDSPMYWAWQGWQARGQVREGWKLVPIEPTSEMLAAANAEESFLLSDEYRAMINAAPKE